MSQQLRGMQAKASGDAFENKLSFTNKQYEKIGWAAIFRSGTKSRAFRKGDGSIGFAAVPSFPDYIGTLAGGQTIAYDAKSTGDKYSWNLTKKRIHQQEDLGRLAIMGALCFFMIEARLKGVVYLLRIDGYDPKKAGVKWSSFQENENDGKILEVKEKGGMYDYLTVVHNYWQREGAL